MYIMPSTPLTCCSIGAATVSATTWALAPGYDAETSTVGGAISGYCASGSVKSATEPPSTITIDSTEAKIGRLMKKLENTSLASESGTSGERQLGPALKDGPTRSAVSPVNEARRISFLRPV